MATAGAAPEPRPQPSTPPAAPWSYREALAWLYARQALGIKLGLAKVERLLHAVGDPQHSFRSVHVAGTNGKGSVTRMLGEVLRRAGHKVGVTTSPHLIRFTERIEVDGQAIGEGDVAQLLHELRGPTAALDADGQPPTFFELVTAMAFLHFARKDVAWAVVETGMGGRLDATNVLEPDLTLITTVAMDHTQHLGDTLEKIAREKAGIMKPGVPLVTGATGAALGVLTAQSHGLQVPMSILGRDYHVVPDDTHLVLLRPNGEARYEVGLHGPHQKENAALVVAAVDALRQRGIPIPEPALRAGLRHATNPGRCDIVQVEADVLAPGAGKHGVTILVDGAHNVQAAEALRTTLHGMGWRAFDLVAGFNADKEWHAALDTWLAPVARLWAVPVRNPRTLDPERLVAAGREAGVRSQAAPDARTALRLAVEAGATRILVAGSLFLAGEALAVLQGRSLEEIHGAQ